MLIIKKASLFFALFMQTVKIIRLLVLKTSTRNTKSGQKHSNTRADTKGVSCTPGDWSQLGH